jgi:hypothetical protein
MAEMVRSGKEVIAGMKIKPTTWKNRVMINIKF